MQVTFVKLNDRDTEMIIYSSSDSWSAFKERVKAMYHHALSSYSTCDLVITFNKKRLGNVADVDAVHATEKQPLLVSFSTGKL